MDFLEMISSTYYFKHLCIFIPVFGSKNTLFLSNLISTYQYLKKKEELDEDDWFYHQMAYQIRNTGLTEETLQKCKKFFRETGILETKIMQNPNRKGVKEFYRLNVNQLQNHMEEKYRELGEVTEIIGTAPCTQKWEHGNPPPCTGNPGHGNLFKNILNIKSFSKEKPKRKPVKAPDNMEDLGKNSRKIDKSPTKLIISQLSPDWGKDPALITAIEDWVEYCLERKKNHFTQAVISGLVNKLNKSSIPEIIQAVENSISSGWIGLFPKPNIPKHAPKLSPRSGRANNDQDYSFSRTINVDDDGKWTEVTQ